MNKKLIVILLIITLLLAYYYVGNGYLKQRQQQAVLATRITTATRVLSQLPSAPADLEQRLATANTGLEAARNEFPDFLNSTGIIDHILRLAESSGVRTVPLASQAWTQQQVGEHNYHVFRLNLNVEGDFSNFTDFLNRLEMESYETLVVEELRLSQVEEPPEAPAAGQLVAASLNIIIYTQ